MTEGAHNEVPVTLRRNTEGSSDLELLRVGDISVVLPEKPWMPTHTGVEIRVEDTTSQPLVERESITKPVSGLLKVGRVAVIASETAGMFSEVDDPENPDWYDKPWFNLNFNSQLGDERMDHLLCQVYLRARTLGQMRKLKTHAEYKEESDYWSNPYWTVPIPVDYPLDSSDRRPYSLELQEKIQRQLNEHFEKLKENQVFEVKLFTETDGSKPEDYSFQINSGNYPVWQMGDYLLVTQDNPLVDRKDGVHLVLIYRGEQQEEKERLSFLWRDPRRIAEMAIIAAAASKIITTYGYNSESFDKSYIHFNANWSLDFALPVEERHEVMDFGSVGPGKWPGPKNRQKVPGPNAHPHIQVLKVNKQDEVHNLDIPPSGRRHSQNPRSPQTGEEIEALKRLFDAHLTPLIKELQGKMLEEN